MSSPDRAVEPQPRGHPRAPATTSPPTRHGDDRHAGHDGHGGRDKHAGHDPGMFRRRLWWNLVLAVPVLVFSDQIQVWFHRGDAPGALAGDVKAIGQARGPWPPWPSCCPRRPSPIDDLHRTRHGRAERSARNPRGCCEFAVNGVCLDALTVNARGVRSWTLEHQPRWLRHYSSLPAWPSLPQSALQSARPPTPETDGRRPTAGRSAPCRPRRQPSGASSMAAHSDSPIPQRPAEARVTSVGPTTYVGSAHPTDTSSAMSL